MAVNGKIVLLVVVFSASRKSAHPLPCQMRVLCFEKIP